MPEEYTALAAAMKALAKGTEVLPVAEDEWATRPDADNYGIIALEFEADHYDGDNRKQHRSYEGSMDLYSRKKDGDGWIPLIEGMLTEHCDSCWVMNRPGYENQTRLYHWEWVFQIEG